LNIIDPYSFGAIDEYAQKLFDLRKGKIKSLEEARALLDSKLYFGTMLVKLGEADGMVAGAANTTADVLRPAYQIIKTAPGIALASAYFAMIIPNCSYGENGFVIYADAGGVPDPSVEELAEIAITSCLTIKNIFGVEEPRCAMLSYSTKGSASHPLVDKVVEATRIANQKRPDLLIDGELQGDAAFVPEIGKKKAPNSPVAGKANILVFPDLNSGNIAYKLTERLAGAEAYGPLMQGLAKPINDLSRGCKPSDIVNVAAIVAVKAQVPYGSV
jgi:phosphate acetyltransferase